MFEPMPKHSTRSILILLGLASGLSCASEDDVAAPEPAIITLEIAPPSLGILRGESASISVKVTRSGGFTGSVHLSTSGAPVGVSSTVLNGQASGSVTTATITLDVDEATRPGGFALLVSGTGDGVVPATAEVHVTVLVSVLSCPPAGVCEQWATGATASSEYSSNEWSALQAAGAPDVLACTDDPHAWASAEPDGVDWLELSYPISVRPTEIQVYENFGVSSIVRVEVGDGTGTYHTVYTAPAGFLTCPRTLAIPVTDVTMAIRVVRVSLDQRTLRDWNEIDAVKLTGTR